MRHEVIRSDTPHPVFHGSWDWHSSVHGHWALLRLAEMRGDERMRCWVTERLSGEGLREEFRFLNTHPAFERPYGRAWLLRLMIAFERTSRDLSFRAQTSEIAADLIAGIQATGLDVSTPEYQNPIWAMVQLHAWAHHVEDRATQNALRRLVAPILEGPVPALGRDSEPPGEFFSHWALHALLIGQVMGDSELVQWLERQSVGIDVLEPISDYGSAHHLAINASRAWGFAIAARATGERRWREAYESHLRASLALHEPWHHDRRSYTHWVPQFTVYALSFGKELIPPTLSPGGA